MGKGTVEHDHISLEGEIKQENKGESGGGGTAAAGVMPVHSPSMSGPWPFPVDIDGRWGLHWASSPTSGGLLSDSNAGSGQSLASSPWRQGHHSALHSLASLMPVPQGGC